MVVFAVLFATLATAAALSSPGKKYWPPGNTQKPSPATGTLPSTHQATLPTAAALSSPDERLPENTQKQYLDTRTLPSTEWSPGRLLVSPPPPPPRTIALEEGKKSKVGVQEKMVTPDGLKKPLTASAAKTPLPAAKIPLPASSSSSSLPGGLLDASQLEGRTVTLVSTGQELPALAFLAALKPDTCLILGTYAADFNALEYAQRVSYYLPSLEAKGVKSVCMVLNASPAACKEFSRIMGLPAGLQLVSDSYGAVGRAYGCNRGWRPDDLTSPYVKLLGMLFGLGAVMTLPSVIGGYVGNPWQKQSWIEASLARNQAQGIWPTNALELDDAGRVITNKFAELPVVGGWGRRPLELATLRLQNMLGISLKHWRELRPTEEELERGLLTQLGGLVVYGATPSQVRYKWLDGGICDVCNFETLLEKLT